MLDTALTLSGYEAKRALFAVENANPERRIKRGIGLATFFHGSGFTGSGELNLASVAGVVARPSSSGGGVEVLAASTEIGQGTNTIFSADRRARAGPCPTTRSASRAPTRRKVPELGPHGRVAHDDGRRLAGRERVPASSRAELGRALTAARRGRGVQPRGVPAPRSMLGTHGSRRRRLEVAAASTSSRPASNWDDKLYRG